MREILEDILKWFSEGKLVTVATVIETWGSSPRKAGAQMAISSEGDFTGSLSGGCIESSVLEESGIVLETGKAKLLHYGVSDDSAWEVGLACGGKIKVFIHPVSERFIGKLSVLIDDNSPFTYSLVIDGPSSKLGQMSIQTGFYKGSYPRIEKEEISKEIITKFVNISLPDPVLIIIGGVHIAIKLAQIAKILEYKTIVIDPRRTFSKRKRFPEVDRLITSWPKEALTEIDIHNSTAIVVLTHDPKIDDPALIAALRSPASYIGALGSEKTQRDRYERLECVGFSNKQLERIKSPIGIDIGSQLPSEVALAIMAEIVSVKRGVG